MPQKLGLKLLLVQHWFDKAEASAVFRNSINFTPLIVGYV